MIAPFLVDLTPQVKGVGEHFGLTQTQLEKLFENNLSNCVEQTSIVSLLIKIEVFIEISDSYKVQAWLRECKQDTQEIYHPLEMDPDQIITLGEMPELLGQLLDRDEIIDLRKYSKEELTIEFFLPKQLLCEDVEHWIPPECDEPIGVSYCVIIRSTERMMWKRLQIQWYKYWNRCKDKLQSNLKAGEIRLNEPQQNWRSELDKCLIFFTLNFVAESDFVYRLIQAGIPLALWPRQPVQKEIYQEFSALLSSCHKLEELPELIRQKRMEIWETNNRQHTGHISLLWDYPLWDYPNKSLPQQKRQAPPSIF
jgi:hypothetical protein